MKILTLIVSIALTAITALGFADDSSRPTSVVDTTISTPVPSYFNLNTGMSYTKVQTSTPGAANPLATLNLGLSGFVQGKQTYVVILAPISNFYKSPTGKYSIDLQGFTGYDSTNSKGIVGTGITGSYKLSSTLNAMAGLGVSVPYNTFTWSEVNKNTIGLLIGIVGKF